MLWEPGALRQIESQVALKCLFEEGGFEPLLGKYMRSSSLVSALPYLTDEAASTRPCSILQ